jgi:hypothetical protein
MALGRTSVLVLAGSAIAAVSAHAQPAQKPPTCPSAPAGTPQFNGADPLGFFKMQACGENLVEQGIVNTQKNQQRANARKYNRLPPKPDEPFVPKAVWPETPPPSPQAWIAGSSGHPPARSRHLDPTANAKSQCVRHACVYGASPAGPRPVESFLQRAMGLVKVAYEDAKPYLGAEAPAKTAKSMPHKVKATMSGLVRA